MPTLQPGPGARIARTVLLPLLLTSTIYTALESQDTTRMSATLLRVLAEAADGYRTGQPVYFVADHRFPHQVLGSFASRGAADSVRADSGATFAVFGPYVTQRTARPDTASRLVGITLTMSTSQGTRTIDLDPQQIDALFLTRSAFEKFAIPYSTRVHGPAYALGLLRRMGPTERPTCHVANSAFCWPSPGGLQMLRGMDPARPPR
jgi:hypothetical protein